MMMTGPQKSDGGTVPVKVPNKDVRTSAEVLEGRTPTEGKTGSQSTYRTQSRASVSQAADRIRQAAKRKPEERLTTLLHHVTVEALRGAYHALNPRAAAGVDRMTWDAYGEGLEERMLDLHDRVQSGAYRALPVRRVEIPKPDGGTRPLGITSLEDKIVQKVIADVILTPIYEPVFLGLSYGFRPGRSAHDALDALAYCIDKRKVNWILDADIRQFFDTLDRDWLIRFLEHRIGDRRVIRLIIKWLNAGVMEGTEWKDDLCGSPQGSVISPILANIYLHYVLDLWFDRKWRKQTAQGEAVLIRYADDFVAGFETRRDAEQFRSDLEQRLNKFGLALHPDKTRCIEFGRYAMANRRARGQRRPETFHFLGFTHYCRTTRKGRFGLGRKPQARRVRRTLKRIGLVLRRRRHDPPEEVAVWLRSVLGGWLRYFAVPTSHPYLSAFIDRVKWLWFRQLRRRSQRRSILDLWELVKELASSHFPALRIMHPWPNQRFQAVHTRGRSPVR